MHLGGYGFGSGPILTGRTADGILGPGIHVRAIAISDGKRSMAVADIETQGWFTATKDGPYGLVDMRKRVQAADRRRADRRRHGHPVRPLALGPGHHGRMGRRARWPTGR